VPHPARGGKLRHASAQTRVPGGLEAGEIVPGMM
jgi:hypothetical protein